MLGKPRKGYYNLLSSERRTIGLLINSPEEAFFSAIRKSVGQSDAFAFYYAAVAKWKESGFREIYPDIDTCNICDNTNVLDNLRFNELRNYYPAFCINIPREFNLAMPKWGKLTFALVAFRSKNVYICFHWENRPPAILKMGGTDFLIKDALPKVEYDFDPEYGDNPPTEPLDKFFSFVANMILLMKMYPKFVDTYKSHFKMGPKVVKNHEQHVRIGKELLVENTVYRDLNKQKSIPSGRIMPTHWRKGHWRRQFHGDNYQTDHTCGVFEDGRKYHLIFIAPVLIHGEV